MPTAEQHVSDHEYAQQAYTICAHHHLTGEPGCIAALKSLFADYRTHNGERKPHVSQPMITVKSSTYPTFGI